MEKIHVDGNIRSYLFDRIYGNQRMSTQQSFSLGGKINALTGSYHNFKLGMTAYTAQPLDLNSNNRRKVDLSLPGNEITTLGQTFLQFENPVFLTRIGNQLIDSPWLNPSDTRMIPATYQAVFFKIMPMPAFELSAMRVTRFKPRIYSNFTRTNLYMPTDEGTPIAALDNQTTNGTLAFGAQYTIKHQLQAKFWTYKFYDYAKLIYAEGSYEFRSNAAATPSIGIELAREYNDGNRALSKAHAGTTNAALCGIQLAIDHANGANLSIAYDYMPKHPGAFKNGDIVSPYTTFYATDPLYTTSMIAGLIEKASGAAVKLSGKFYVFDKQLGFKMSFARYLTAPFMENSSETNLDIKFSPHGKFSHLTLRYRLGYLNQHPTYDKFIYSRLMLEYDFVVERNRDG
jgi:hypothetical protein